MSLAFLNANGTGPGTIVVKRLSIESFSTADSQVVGDELYFHVSNTDSSIAVYQTNDTGKGSAAMNTGVVPILQIPTLFNDSRSFIASATNQVCRISHGVAEPIIAFTQNPYILPTDLTPLDSEPYFTGGDQENQTFLYVYTQ